MINFRNQPRENNLIEKPISEFLSGVNGLKHTSVEFYIHSLMRIVTAIRNIHSSMNSKRSLASFIEDLQSDEAAPYYKPSDFPSYFKPNDQMSANLRNKLNSLDFQNKNSGIGYRIANYKNRTHSGQNLNQYCDGCKQEILGYLEEVYPVAEQEKFEKAATRIRTQFR